MTHPSRINQLIKKKLSICTCMYNNLWSTFSSKTIISKKAEVAFMYKQLRPNELKPQIDYICNGYYRTHKTISAPWHRSGTTGAFPKGNVVAGETYFPNFNKVEALTKTLALDIAERMQQDLSMREQLNLSYDAHFNLVSIHPFYDGNGRTSRLLMNYIQAVFRLPLAIVHNETKTDYYQALIDTRKQENINIFRAFMDNEYKMFLSAEISKFEEMQHPKKGKGFTFLF